MRLGPRQVLIAANYRGPAQPDQAHDVQECLFGVEATSDEVADEGKAPALRVSRLLAVAEFLEQAAKRVEAPMHVADDVVLNQS